MENKIAGKEAPAHVGNWSILRYGIALLNRDKRDVSRGEKTVKKIVHRI